MTDSFGFIHEKLEIKVLILYILKRLPAGIGINALADLTLIDGGINYFEFSECVADLVRTGHVGEADEKYSITDKGLRNCAAMEDGLPTSVRLKAEKKTAEAALVLKREAMIKTSCAERGDGTFTVYMSLSDGIDNIINLELLAGDKAQTESLRAGFREKAERIYNKIVEIILE